MNAPSDPDLRRRQAICAAVLIAQGLYTFAVLPAIPSLIGSDPVLLELLRGSTAAMVAGGAFARVGRASLALALLAPFPTLMMSDPFVWWAGRLWGPTVVEFVSGRSERAQRRTHRAVGLIERWRAWAIVLAYVLPIPSALVYAAAGWTGMSLLRFLVLDVMGTLLWVALVVGLGYALGHPAVNVAHAITHYSLWFTLALVVLSVALAVWRAPRQPPDPGGPRL
jgi:membrane protein DedA with SNARE-associated domain